MRYQFSCYECCNIESIDSKPFHPPEAPLCPKCSNQMDRMYGCQINTNGCKDADFIPPEKRVFDSTDRRSEAVKEAAFQRHIQGRRNMVAEAGRSPTGPRMTHSVPADLYHGKIRETGDKQYWNDPSNLKKHSSCKVD